MLLSDRTVLYSSHVWHDFRAAGFYRVHIVLLREILAHFSSKEKYKYCCSEIAKFVWKIKSFLSQNQVFP